MAQVFAKYPAKVLFGKRCLQNLWKVQTPSSACSALAPKLRVKTTPLARYISTTSVSWIRKKKGSDGDGDFEDAPQSMAHAMRREMQQRREKELMQKPGPGRLAHYDESSTMGLGGKTNILSGHDILFVYLFILFIENCLSLQLGILMFKLFNFPSFTHIYIVIC